MNIISQTIQDIKSLKNQGATNIVKVSLTSLKTYLVENPQLTADEFKENINALISARPTEPFVQNVLNSLIQNLEPFNTQNVIDKIVATEVELQKKEQQIIENGVELLKDKSIILTHCHSSNVENILKKIHLLKPNLKVFATHTEPRHQGEITARNLAAAGVDVTLIIDSEASFLVSQEDDQSIDAVLIGADALLPDSSVINKVGSYGISLSAHNAQIPLYVVASLLKFAPNGIEIEERNEKEVWVNPPAGVKILNPAFDRVPSDFITALITESGIIKPSELSKIINYT